MPSCSATLLPYHNWLDLGLVTPVVGHEPGPLPPPAKGIPAGDRHVLHPFPTTLILFHLIDWAQGSGTRVPAATISQAWGHPGRDMVLGAELLLLLLLQSHLGLGD